jgi:type I restriction-modification system DNA methylase subunit
MDLSSASDEKKRITEFLTKQLTSDRVQPKAREEERKRYGEVFTPIPLIELICSWYLLPFRLQMVRSC